MPLLNYLKDKIEATFKDNPFRFFTEHDIHTELALILIDYLKKEGTLLTTTKDNFIVSRVHHEYPTPFRCDMNGFNFRIISEDEFDRKRQEKRGFRARRGYIDLVVLSQDFINSNKLTTISGKRYKQVLSGLKEQKYTALELAVEVVYHPTFDERLHKGILQRRVKSTEQDYKKLVELGKFSLNGNPFCKEAAMMFFSNTLFNDTVNNLFQSFPEDSRVQIIKTVLH